MIPPNGKVHFLYGVVLYIIAYKWLMFIPLIIGSMLPDCDIKHAPAAKFFPLYKIKGVRHRGITHTMWACGAFSLLYAGLFGYNGAESLAIGYFLHLLLDSTTPAGIHWFGRWRKRKPR